ncbi:hypothetical protein OCU04_002625 [Sclerotinia nivalis]|uniref:Uncharacterized protein n=1 Tax=Sclerotinia nivalis TaxID=352851 RepID=A0A9X0DMS8_9HELO|nr:hypothetical protein OCU04_002625 [Sclerotinia nivalis]
MLVSKLRALVLFWIILVLCYTWKFFRTNNVVDGKAVISQDFWDQVKENNEVLHDVKVEEERLMTTSSATSRTEEIKISTSPGVVVVMDSALIPSPTPTPYTPHVAAEPSQSETAPDEASNSRSHYPSKQTPSPKLEDNKKQNTLSQAMIKDNFSLAMNARSAADLPPIPPWNKPPTPHVKEKTPLFIAFTRNWLLLQQTVVSWITSGWPAEDIYVIENTGTMRSNELGRLSLQNPFFLNHTRLHMLGVNVIVTPTLYTFAQLQNFFLWTAIEKDLETYFWSHMDIIPITFEEGISASNGYAGHKTIYQHAVEVLRSAQSPDPDPNASDPSKPWAMRFFAFDYLTLVNRAAFESVGGFDTTIPFYHTDCDMYARLLMAGYEANEPRHLMTTFGNDFAGMDKFGSGIIYDIASSIDDLIALYRKKNTVEASFKGETGPKDSEAARKHDEEQSKTVKQAQWQEEAHKKAEGNQKQAATDDDDAQAHAKAMEEQAPDNKAEAQNEGHVKDTPKTDVDTSDSDIQQAPDIHQELQEAKETEEKESSPMVAKDLSQSGSSVDASEAGKYKKRDLEDYSINPQLKSLEDLHHGATSKRAPKESTTPTSSTSTSTYTPPDSNSKWITDEPGTPAYFQLLQVATNMVLEKYSQGAEGRNKWQHQQSGGEGEPYYRHAESFEKARQLTIGLGRRVYLEKWGTLECKLIQGGLTLDDEWKPKEGSE